MVKLSDNFELLVDKKLTGWKIFVFYKNKRFWTDSLFQGLVKGKQDKVFAFFYFLVEHNGWHHKNCKSVETIKGLYEMRPLGPKGYLRIFLYKDEDSQSLVLIDFIQKKDSRKLKQKDLSR